MQNDGAVSVPAWRDIDNRQRCGSALQRANTRVNRPLPSGHFHGGKSLPTIPLSAGFPCFQLNQALSLPSRCSSLDSSASKSQKARRKSLTCLPLSRLSRVATRLLLTFLSWNKLMRRRASPQVAKSGNRPAGCRPAGWFMSGAANPGSLYLLWIFLSSI